ncbi:lysophospholipid acyltransferase family protein [Olivibacter sp. CPCC 100613]|uniref:lysophospholipid acyltransferase family protein n=1 Tax=Olivibacter sp. CPCC 100613 TaxID=3079931 RepID=UPI002FF5DA41
MFFLKMLSKLPLSVLYCLADFLAFIAFNVIKYRRSVVFDNLSKAFPAKQKAELNKIAKKFYMHLADWLIETLKASNLSETQLKRRVHFEHTELIREYLDQDKSVIVLTAHQFNWEWVLLSGCLAFEAPIDAIYMPVSNKRVESFLLSIRSRFGGSPIPKDEALSILVKRIKKKRIIAMVADQRPPQHATDKYWSHFLQQETAFYLGPETLPKFIKLPVFFMRTHKTGRGRYTVSIEKIAEPPYDYLKKEIMPLYIEKLEELLEKHPDNWLWTHKRWKYTRGAYE